MNTQTTLITNDSIRDFLIMKIYGEEDLPPDLQNIEIGKWDVSGVTNMHNLFSNFSDFNEPLNKWNVSNVTNMSNMFSGCENFNQPLNKWNVSNVTNMSNMFSGCRDFNQPLNKWSNSISNVTNMSNMFSGCENFNQPLNKWNVSNVTNMFGMFSGCSDFNEPLNKWNVSNVTNMFNMFYACRDFNKPLNDWANSISNVTNMSSMFSGCENFNQPLNDWNVSNVTNMSSMFEACRDFNQPLNDWANSISNVTNMSSMFSLCRDFNQPLNDWNVANVTNMKGMFSGCENFNQPLNNWANSISNVTNMFAMFSGCRDFNQPLNNWIIRNDADVRIMFFGSDISPENLPPAILPPPPRPPTPPPRRQQRPIGMAFQIHNAFHDINVDKVTNFLESKTDIPNAAFFSMDKTEFLQVIKQNMDSFISLLPSGAITDTNSKEFFQSYFDTLLNDRISGVSEYDNKLKAIIGQSLLYTSKQSDSFKITYVTNYITENFTAYGDGTLNNNNLSCTKGILERFVLIFRDTIPVLLSDETNLTEPKIKEYKTLVKLLLPIKDLITDYTIEWVNKNQGKNELIKEKNPKTLDTKMEELKDYLIKELGITEEEAVSPDNPIMRQIYTSVNEVRTMAEDYEFGGRKRRRTFKSKNKRNSSHKKKGKRAFTIRHINKQNRKSKKSKK